MYAFFYLQAAKNDLSEGINAQRICMTTDIITHITGRTRMPNRPAICPVINGKRAAPPAPKLSRKRLLMTCSRLFQYQKDYTYAAINPMEVEW